MSYVWYKGYRCCARVKYALGFMVRGCAYWFLLSSMLTGALRPIEWCYGNANMSVDDDILYRK